MSEELDTVASTLKGWLAEDDVEPFTIGVLTRSARTRDLVQRGLTDRDLPAHVVAGDDTWTVPAPDLLTTHRAKGLEFHKVILVGIDDQLPSRQFLGDMPTGERADVTDRERFLRFVAATRAREDLVLSWHGRPSAFLTGVVEGST